MSNLQEASVGQQQQQQQQQQQDPGHLLGCTADAGQHPGMVASLESCRHRRSSHRRRRRCSSDILPGRNRLPAPAPGTVLYELPAKRLAAQVGRAQLSTPRPCR